MARLTRRLTYANITSTLALFVALGGASYAAVALPRNSVGSAQVRDGSLRVRDFNRSRRKFTVYNKVVSVHNVDDPPAGASQGDLFAFVSDSLSRSGRKLGENQGFCVMIEPGRSSTCTETFALRGGEIHVVGTTGAGSGAAVVIGGTGAYAGAAGRALPGKPVNGTFPDTFQITIPR